MAVSGVARRRCCGQCLAIPRQAAFDLLFPFQDRFCQSAANFVAFTSHRAEALEKWTVNGFRFNRPDARLVLLVKPCELGEVLLLLSREILLQKLPFRLKIAQARAQRGNGDAGDLVADPFLSL